MKHRILVFILCWGAIISSSIAQVTASQDTIVIPGDIPHSAAQHAGALESTINGDTTNAGARINPNRVYALQEGHFYYQNSAITVNDPNGTLTIVGIPDSAGTTKPVWLMQPLNHAPVAVNIGGSSACNAVYGSIKLVNIHYQAMPLDGSMKNENFLCGTKDKAAQSLTIDNCLFEFSSIDLFDCSNELGAIGGWPYGAKFFITNSYFRNLFEPSQWWSSRIFQCKHPIDTLWVENNTIAGGGLIFLQQNELTDFGYFNHNTIINSKKNWLSSLFYRTYFVTNNIFINQNWSGEDTNEMSSGQDPRKEFQSTIDIDSVNANEGVVVQPQYYVGDSLHYSPLLALNKLEVYVSNNISYSDPLLTSGYDVTAPGTIDSTSYPLSYLGWSYPGTYRVNNIPCEWENSRTSALFAAHSPGQGGGFIERNTMFPAVSPFAYGMTPEVVAAMAAWNQHQYNDPRYPVSPDMVHTNYIYGDYDPTTIPGRDSSGSKSENGSGITKFTDLSENFSQSTMVSTIDNFPVGSLLWNDTENSAYAAAHQQELETVFNSYFATGMAVKPGPVVAAVFGLAQNYPNPFNPSTKIEFSIPAQSRVQLKVFNMLGQEVATLVNGTLPAGSHSAVFDARDLASGLYLYRLTAGSFTSVRKMLLLK